VQRVGGHDLAVQVKLAEDDRGHGYLVRLGADRGLGGDHRGRSVRPDEGGEQADLGPVRVPGAPDRLAVQPDLRQCRRAVLPDGGGRPCEPGEARQPGAARCVEFPGPGIGEHPPDRGLRRRRGRRGAAAQVQAGQSRRRHVRNPPGDCGTALHPGHDRRRGQRQHRRDGMVPALPRPPVRHLGQQFQQF
jgi:hypothetical protein